MANTIAEFVRSRFHSVKQRFEKRLRPGGSRIEERKYTEAYTGKLKMEIPAQPEKT
jgi:hypothetical protein